MSELAARILRILHENYMIGAEVPTSAIMNRLSYEYVLATKLIAALRELESFGYIQQVPGAAWKFLATDRSTTCSVCAKYAPKQCPGYKWPFCETCYAVHIEHNAAWF